MNMAHYIDWNVTKRFSAGFFQAVTWADAEPEGKRGFDFNYAHPFVFLRSVESANTTSPDKMRLGFNLKYEVLIINVNRKNIIIKAILTLPTSPAKHFALILKLNTLKTITDIMEVIKRSALIKAI